MAIEYIAARELNSRNCDIPELLSYMGLTRTMTIGSVFMFTVDDESKLALMEVIHRIHERFPERDLVPMARHTVRDTTAFIDLGNNFRIVEIHDWSIPGYPDERTYETLECWFLTIVKEFVEVATGKLVYYSDKT
jgi:hypothetical protein